MADKSLKTARLLWLFKLFQASRRRTNLIYNTILLQTSRRRSLLRVYLIIMLLISSDSQNTTARPSRSCRRLLRNCGWWDLVWNNYSDARFKKTFRVSKRTFLYILDHIRHVIEHDSVNEAPVSPEQRLAICLYRLGRGDYYYTISEMTGLGVSTICSIVIEVSQALVSCLWEDSVQKYMPKTEEDFKNKMLDMDESWQFTCCWAAIDGCHIPIKCPSGGMEACKEYHNFKNFYSVVLMGLVDSRYRFIWASCGFPGNSHDAIILQSTDLWQQLKHGNLISNIAKNVGGVEIPPVILGDSAFPFERWLMKPYTCAVPTSQQTYYNYRLSRARMVTEAAYGHLKGRWRILMRKCESSGDTMSMITLACIILHNICIEKGDSLSKKLDLTIDPQTNQKRNREKLRKLLKMRSCKSVRDTSVSASCVREALAKKFWCEKETGYVY